MKKRYVLQAGGVPLANAEYTSLIHARKDRALFQLTTRTHQVRIFDTEKKEYVK